MNERSGQPAPRAAGTQPARAPVGAATSRAFDRCRDWGGLLLWGLLAAAAGLSSAGLEPNLLEEGIVVHTASRMVEGEHLYRDVILHTAPLPYELLALLFRIFGNEIAVARTAVLLLQVVGVLLCFDLVRRAGAGVLAHAVAAILVAAPILLVPLFSIFFYSTLAFYLGLAAVCAAARIREASGWPLATGALLAAVALCKQSTGLALSAALVAAVCLTAPSGQRLRRIAALCLGGIGIAALTLGVYALRGDLRDFVFAQTRLALAMGSAASFGAPLIDLWPPGALDGFARENWMMVVPSLYPLRTGLHAPLGAPIVLLTQALYALPFCALAATALAALAGRCAAIPWLHAAFVLAMALNLFPRADWGHLVVALPASLVQLVLLGAPRIRSEGLRRAAATVLVSGTLIAAGTVGLWLHHIAGAPNLGPRVPLRPISPATLGPSLPRVVRHLRARVRPREAIFVARQEPLLYFATDTTNPTPFEGVLQGLRELQEPRILAALDPVRFVVMSDIDQPLYTYYAEELPAVWAYLERHFRIPSDFPLDDASWINVLERGPDRGASAVDLGAGFGAVRAFIRGPDARELPVAAAALRLAARQLRRPLPVALGPRGGGLDFDLDIPARGVLQTAVGLRNLVSSAGAHLHPPHSTAFISIRTREAGDFAPLAAVPVDAGPAGGRRWRAIEVDLARFAGRRVTLRLEFRAESVAESRRLAWFGSPRIALRP